MKTTKEKIAVMRAFADGKKIECKAPSSSEWDLWRIADEPCWNWNDYDYRIAAEPKLRPWKPEEVPVGALIRHRDYKAGRTIILYVYDGLIVDATPVGKGSNKYTADRALDYFEHSTDYGKTWLPCGAVE